jgi:hypothetical protein
MLQPSVVQRLLTGWPWDGAVETNGTLPRLGDFAYANPSTTFVVSPKLDHAATTHPGVNPDVLRQLAPLPNCHLKLVCRDAMDVAITAAMATDLAWPTWRVWCMPEGRTPAGLDRHLARITEPAIALGLNVTDRLHVRRWGNTRGH